MNDIAKTLDKSVAAAKSTYAKVDPERLASFLEKVFGAKVSLEEIGGGAAKSGSSSGILIFTARIHRESKDEVKRLVVDSQQVVLGETESTDGCLIFNAAMGSMEVVSMRPVMEACGSLV